MKLTVEQFEAVAKLGRMLPSSARYRCARLQLVDGMRGADAAREVGTTPQVASNALTACRATLQLARMALGDNSGTDA